jgi:hypothetical protein
MLWVAPQVEHRRLIPVEAMSLEGFEDGFG